MGDDLVPERLITELDKLPGPMPKFSKGIACT